MSTNDKTPRDDEDEREGPEEPLDLKGYATMQQTFGEGANRKSMLVSKGMTLNQLTAAAK